MIDVRHLGISEVRNFKCRYGSGVNCVTVQNIMPIGQVVAEIWRFFDFLFSKWRPSAILDFYRKS